MNTLERLYRTKLALLAFVTTAFGVAALFLAQWVDGGGGPLWLRGWPLGEIGSTLFSSGLIVIAFEYLDREDSEARAVQRLDAAITAKAPVIRDAVIAGFAFDAADLARIASPETLDTIGENVLALRMGDRQLAEGIYRDLLGQVIASPDRRYDADVSIDLAPWPQGGPAGDEASMFVATVRWQYRTVPGRPLMRFSSTSDPETYRELLADSTSSLSWFFTPVGELTGGSPDAFRLLQFTVDGVPRKIRRTPRARGQTYTVTLDTAVERSGRSGDSADAPEVTIAYTYQVLVRRHGHLLYLSVGALTKNFRATLRYGGCGIRGITTLDFISSAEPTHLSSTPADVPTPAVEVSFDGWVQPRSGIAFSWVLDDEFPHPHSSGRGTAM